jgi:hypothetical protein
VRKESENIFTFKGKESREISLGNYSRITTLIQHVIHVGILQKAKEGRDELLGKTVARHCACGPRRQPGNLSEGHVGRRDEDPPEDDEGERQSAVWVGEVD